MRGTWINKFRQPELLNSSQPLESASLEHAPHGVLELGCTKFDEIVEWISNALSSIHVPTLFT